jgi:Protein of unknown function (DUF3108)
MFIVNGRLQALLIAASRNLTSPAERIRRSKTSALSFKQESHYLTNPKARYIGDMKRLAVLLPFVLLCTPPAFGDQVHETAYSVSLAGLPIAKAHFKTQVIGDRFSITGAFESSGIIRFFKRITAQVAVEGKLSGTSWQPLSYDMAYRSGKKKRSYRASFSRNKLMSAAVIPEPNRPKSWIPLPQLPQSARDPLTGLIVPSSTTPCAGDLPIFDGETLMQLDLASKSVRPFSTRGFSGQASVCSVKFTPRGGYKRGRSDFEYLRNSNAMEIWFIRIDTWRIYAPVRVSIPTKYGTLVVSATKV